MIISLVRRSSGFSDVYQLTKYIIVASVERKKKKILVTTNCLYRCYEVGLLDDPTTATATATTTTTTTITTTITTTATTTATAMCYYKQTGFEGLMIVVLDEWYGLMLCRHHLIADFLYSSPFYPPRNEIRRGERKMGFLYYLKNKIARLSFLFHFSHCLIYQTGATAIIIIMLLIIWFGSSSNSRRL